MLEQRRRLEGVILDEVDALDDQEDGETEGDSQRQQQDHRLVEQVPSSGSEAI